MLPHVLASFTRLARPVFILGAAGTGFMFTYMCRVGVNNHRVDVYSGSGMVPALPEARQLHLLKIVDGRYQKVNYGDIVSTRSLDKKEANYLGYRGYVAKRVVGLPGDKVLNDKTGEWDKVPGRHVYVIGDNREDSYDSRDFGPIPMSYVNGKVVKAFYLFGKVDGDKLKNGVKGNSKIVRKVYDDECD
ncbi:hypothetical protein L596_030376 [Steinernema carpocapsae]|uniref:IMP2-like protein n=1 Tax=Steinernema carpocapsae TaxID=34508 RepID=A0A4U5LP70_STECR|nr:hypothetical protein L596_030376 [Steinernema carpocapsae]